MKRLVLIFLVSLAVLFIAACTKTSVNGSVSPTYLRMINTCYGQSFNLEVGGKQLLSGIAFDSISPYANGTSGFYSLNVIDNNKTDSVVLTGNINLQSGLYYSLFLVPDSAQGSDSVLYSLISNTVNRPLYDSTKIQFLDYAYNLPPISFCLAPQYGILTDTIGGLLNPIYQSRTYMDINSTPALAQFQTVHINTYNFIFYADTGVAYIRQIIYDTVVTLSRQALYTIYMEGNYNSRNADSLKVKFVQQ